MGVERDLGWESDYKRFRIYLKEKAPPKDKTLRGAFYVDSNFNIV